MDEGPFSPKTPTARAWWNLMRDDESWGDESDALHSPTPTPGSVVSSFWTATTNASSKDESEIRAASFDNDVGHLIVGKTHRPSLPLQTKLSQNSSTPSILKNRNRYTPYSPTESHEGEDDLEMRATSYDDTAATTFSSRSDRVTALLATQVSQTSPPPSVRKNRPRSKELPENQREKACSFHMSPGKFLDVMNENMCKLENSRYLDVAEDVVVKHVDEDQHPAVWDFLGGRLRSDFSRNASTLSTTDTEVSFEFNPLVTNPTLHTNISHPPATTAEICADLESNLCRVDELEREFASSRVQSTMTESSKYRDLLRGTGPLIEKAVSGEDVLRDLSLPIDTTRTMDTKDEEDVGFNSSSVAEPGAVEVTFKPPSPPTPPPPPPPPPPPSPFAPPQNVDVDRIIDSCSVLTDKFERPLDKDGYDPFESEGLPKTCLSPGRIFSSPSKRTSKMLRLIARSFSSTATSVPNIGTSKSDAVLSEASSAVYSHSETGSAEADRTNSYIAYFQRGEKPSDCLRIYEQPTPPRFPTMESEVVVLVEASTISESDCCIRQGQWWSETSKVSLSLPIVPGVAFCGVIAQECKSGRSGLRRGDRVISLVRAGANSRHLCVHKDAVVKVPKEMDPRSSTCLPELYLTAFQALHMWQKNVGRYSSYSLKGESILIIGGHKLLGKIAIALAVAANASAVYATCPEEESGDMELLGAIPLSSDPDKWLSLVLGRLDRVIGVENATTTDSELKTAHLQALCSKGKIVKVGPPGFLESDGVSLDALDMAGGKTQRLLFHYNVFDYWKKNRKQCLRDLSHLAKLLRDNVIRPSILECVGLGDVARIHGTLEDQLQRGFYLCDPWLPNDDKSAHIQL